MPRLFISALVLTIALPALAEEVPPQFIDDRSSPERVITSLYNAIDRHEYLRAWSYFDSTRAEPYDTFRDGYAETDSVELKIGEVTSEGAAGSIHSTVPVALLAKDAAGTETVFTGCYRLTQVQPAAQDEPPFRPIQIDEGKLAASQEGFENAMGVCTD